MTSAGEVRLRSVCSEDVEHVKRCINDTLDWNLEREFPPYELVIEHPEIGDERGVLMILDL